MKRTHRVMILGLDGATLDVLGPLMASGEAPNLARLAQEGVCGQLRTTVPPLTPPAWTSFMTGRNPGKHGVFYFTARPGNPGSQEFVTARWIGCSTLWESLTEHGLRIGAINVPMTFPPYKVNGFMISGMMTPSESVTYCHPKGLLEELRRNAVEYRLDHNHNLGGGVAKGKDKRVWLREFFDCEERRRSAALYLMKSQPWDLFMVVLALTDHVQHLCWTYHTGAEGNGGLPEELRDAVKTAYRKADDIVGAILSELDEETTVILMSDHGFGTVEKTFLVNRWLKDLGLLKAVPVRPWTLLRTHGLAFSTRTVEDWLTRLGRRGLACRLPGWLRMAAVPLVVPRRKRTADCVDWRCTKAFGAALGIYVNLKGRSERGSVEPGAEYESVRETIVAALKDLRDPETGHLLCDGVWRKEEVYHGPYLEEAPDLFFSLDGLRYMPNTDFAFGPAFRPNPSGTHRMEGILFMRGPGIRRGQVLEGANIVDIAPTVLAVLGQPVPADMDGKVLTEAFEKPPESLREEPAVRGREPVPSLRGDQDYSDTEARKMADRLRGLGYL